MPMKDSKVSVIFMKKFLLLSFASVLVFGFLFSTFSLTAEEKAETATESVSIPVSYHTQIKPIFQAHCQGCHQPAKPQGEYVMTEISALLRGGESGDPAVVAGKPEKSSLMEQITPDNGEALMPQGKAPLSIQQIALIKAWIAQGAKDDTPEDAKKVYDEKHPPVYYRAPVITSMDYSPDGKLLAVSGHHEVLIHKADGSGIVKRLIGVSDRIESVAFSPDGTRLAVTGGAPARMGEVQIWNMATGELQLSVPVTYDTIYGACWSPDSSKLSFGCADNSLRAIDTKTGKEILFQGSHGDWVLDTTFSVDGSFVASVGRDQTAKLTEFETQRFVDNITSITPGALKGGLAAVKRHPLRDEILIGGSDGIPRTYRMQRLTKRVIGDDANLVRQFPAMQGRIFDVAFSPDGKQIVAGSSLNGAGYLAIYSYDVDGTLPDELKKILEERVAARKPEQKKKVQEYRTANIKQIATIELPGNGVYALAYHPDGKQIAVAGANGIIRLIKAKDATTLKEFISVPISKDQQLAKNQGNTWALGSSEKGTEKPLSKETRIVELRFNPDRISLDNPYAYSQVLVKAKLASGDLIDVTRDVEFKINPQIAVIDGQGLLQPRGNGQQVLTATLFGKSATAAVTVSGMKHMPKVDFYRDVTPILSKLGCTQGTCHGADKGKAGFKLSLRGYDPILDVRGLTDDHASRRVNIAVPDESLALLKAIGGVPHGGGQVTTVEHKYYNIMRAWIATGATLNRESPRVCGIELFPKNPVIQAIGSRQQVRVIASYADGTKRDVTRETFVDSGNTEVAEANSSGLLVAVRRGEAPILARYEGSYAATTLTVMGKRDGFQWKKPESFNRIDELVAAKWKRMKILPSDICSDAEFIRRVTLDLTGLPPSVSAVKTFLADGRSSREKREAFVDYLVGSEEYVDQWTNKWADLLQVNGKFLGREGATLFRNWIREQVASNKPYDQFVREIITANGSNKANPPASYCKILRTPEDTMENTTQLFLGVRFNCNKCHDHPFERWTQDQYYEMAAYFSQFELKRAPESKGKNLGGSAVESGKPLYEIVSDKKTGEMKHLRTGEITAPSFPYGENIEIPKEVSRRQQIAAWISSPDNIYFARSYVNRLWGYMFGVGIIEPIDDIRAGNPPTNPELLDYLTQEFIDHNFDVQHIMRLICKSRTYQLSLVTNKWNADDQINFSHAKARRLPAETLYDSIHLVTGSQSKIPGVAPGTRAAALADVQIKLVDGFLSSMGRPVRESSCECERINEVQLGPVMAMVSGPTVATAIADPSNALPQLVKANTDNKALVNELFLRILNRPAKQKELDAVLPAFDDVDPAHALLVKQLAEKEAWWKPIKAKKEKQRVAAIAAATATLKTYQEKMAPHVAKQQKERANRIAAAKKQLADYEASLQAPFVKWEEQTKASLIPWEVLKPSKLTASNKAKLKVLDDGSVLATLKDGQGNYTLIAETDLANITGIQIEALTDPSLPRNGPGLAPDGNFVLSELEVFAGAKSEPKQQQKQELHKAQADFSQANYTIQSAIDGKMNPSNNGWAVSPQAGKIHWATIEFKKPINFEGGNRLKIVLHQRFQGKQHWLGRFRISVTSSKQPVPLGVPLKIAELLRLSKEKRTAEQTATLFGSFKGSDAELTKKKAALATANKPLPADPKLQELQRNVELAKLAVSDNPALVQLRKDVEMSKKLLTNKRLTAAQDITWALINSPAFLFNR